MELYFRIDIMRFLLSSQQCCQIYPLPALLDLAHSSRIIAIIPIQLRGERVLGHLQKWKIHMNFLGVGALRLKLSFGFGCLPTQRL